LPTQSKEESVKEKAKKKKKSIKVAEKEEAVAEV
jgi:hypothetical protein